MAEPPAKRQRPPPPPGRSRDPLQAAIGQLASQLAPELAGWQAKGEVEVEVRLGLLVMTRPDGHRQRLCAHAAGAMPYVLTLQDREKFSPRFEPGVSPDDYQQLQERLRRGRVYNQQRQPEPFSQQPSLSVAYNLAQARVVESPEGVFAQEVKQKIQLREEGPPNTRHCIDIMLPACRYDIRIAAVCETPQPYEQQTAPANWQTKRTKKRTSWSHSQLGWQADFTQVAEQSADGEQRELCEIELELKQSGLAQLGKSSRVEQDLMYLLFSQDLGLIPPVASTNISTKQLTDTSLIQQVANTCKRLGGDDMRGFPGANPVAFRRRHVPEVQTREYMVSEKTDGMRYLVVVLNGGMAVLVDRRMVCFDMHGLSQLQELAQLPAGTVIDGELVLNRSSTGRAGPTQLGQEAVASGVCGV